MQRASITRVVSDVAIMHLGLLRALRWERRAMMALLDEATGGKPLVSRQFRLYRSDVLAGYEFCITGLAER